MPPGTVFTELPSLAAVATRQSERRVDAARYRPHYAVRALLERYSRRQPVLLALDDIHWADAASLEVIAHLLRRFNGPLLIALAYRRAPKPIAIALEYAARPESGIRLDLGPLTADEAQTLLDPVRDAATRAALYPRERRQPVLPRAAIACRSLRGPAGRDRSGAGW